MRRASLRRKFGIASALIWAGVCCGSLSAGATIAQDATPGTTWGGNATGAITVATSSSNTSGTNEVIVCTVALEDPTTVPTVSSVSDTAALTWHLYKRLTPVSLSKVSGGETWWAASAAALTAEVVTFHLSTASYDSAALNCTGWTGVDNSNPFDPNAALPTAQQSAVGPSAPTTGPNISTTNAVTALLLIMVQGNIVGCNGGAAGTGYTTSGFQQNSGGINFG